MKTRFKKDAGDQGENQAVFYLEKKGFKIFERNFRTRNGEIDIIALDSRDSEKVLVCVEVKSRSGNLFGTPLEAITYFKLKALRRTLHYYKATHKGLPELLRIDAVTVEKTPSGEYEIEHHENISF